MDRRTFLLSGALLDIFCAERGRASDKGLIDWCDIDGTVLGDLWFTVVIATVDHYGQLM
jgi:hypothetical protein